MDRQTKRTATADGPPHARMQIHGITIFSVRGNF